MYNRILNPSTHKWINITSLDGKSIINQYIIAYKSSNNHTGGAAALSEDVSSDFSEICIFTLGKYAPFHIGHLYTIYYAIKEVDTLKKVDTLKSVKIYIMPTNTVNKHDGPKNITKINTQINKVIESEKDWSHNYIKNPFGPENKYNIVEEFVKNIKSIGKYNIEIELVNSPYDAVVKLKPKCGKIIFIGGSDRLDDSKFTKGLEDWAKKINTNIAFIKAGNRSTDHNLDTRLLHNISIYSSTQIRTRSLKLLKEDYGTQSLQDSDITYNRLYILTACLNRPDIATLIVNNLRKYANEFNTLLKNNGEKIQYTLLDKNNIFHEILDTAAEIYTKIVESIPIVQESITKPKIIKL